MFALRSTTRVITIALLAGTIATLGASDTMSARTAPAGPPWISIETPVNPYDATTRDAFLLVHAFHHGTPMAFPVTGTAEGIVNGERKSVKLAFAPTSRSGAYALRKQWGTAGVWTLVIAVHQEASDIAQALVEIDATGEVSRVQVPTRVSERGMRVPRVISAREVDETLRLRARVSLGAR